MGFDPVTLEVCWSRLIAIVNEQAIALQRSSFSAVVREAGDLSAGLFDRRGFMIAQAVTGTPGHINTMALAMRHFLAAYPAERVLPGDVLITNDPWKASGHLNDVTLAVPIFRQGRLVGFFASTCHTPDIGGRVLSAEARDVFEEGLFIPITKLYDGGRANEALIGLIKVNTRVPDLLFGDFHGQITGAAVGEQRLNEFMDEFGLDDLQSLADEIIQRSEAATREAMRALRPGNYDYAIELDGYGEPVTIKVRCTVGDGELRVDFDGSSGQSQKGINVPFNYTLAYTTYGIKMIVAPEVPNNEGSFRPVRVAAPEGSILNCRPPAPVAARHVIGHFLPLAVAGALGQAAPERVMAEGAASLCAVQIRGLDLADRPFTYLFFIAGGAGARPGKDGLSATGFPSAVTCTPSEVVEAGSPLVIEEKALLPDSGGAGRFRGGLGQSMRFRVRTRASFTCSVLCDRTRVPARGWAGGEAGAVAELLIDGRKVSSPKAEHVVAPGSTVEIRLAGGGGYGKAALRDPLLVARDLEAGYVSRALAASPSSPSLTPG